LIALSFFYFNYSGKDLIRYKKSPPLKGRLY
jgi:hypothetical protein